MPPTHRTDIVPSRRSGARRRSGPPPGRRLALTALLAVPLMTSPLPAHDGSVFAHGLELIEPQQIHGAWSAIDDTRELRFQFDADGRFHGRIYDLERGGLEATDPGASWTIADSLLEIEAGEGFGGSYHAEALGGGALRLGGLPRGLRPLTLRSAGGTLDSVPRTRWLVGTWTTSYLGIDYAFSVGADGDYRLSATGQPERRGGWRFDGDELVLQTDAGGGGRYSFRAVNDSQFDSSLVNVLADFRRTPAPSPTLATLAGHYIGAQTVLAFDAGGDGRLWFRDNRYTVSASYQAPLLRVAIGGLGDPLKLRIGVDSLLYAGGPTLLGFPERLVALLDAETAPPADLTGAWRYRISSNAPSDLYLYDGRRYAEPDSINAEKLGDYQLTASTLTLRRRCLGDRVSTARLDGNFLFLRTDVGSALELEQGYVYVPGSAHYVERVFRDTDARSAAEDAQWRRRIPVYSPVRPHRYDLDIARSVDPDPDPLRVYSGATVMTELEGYERYDDVGGPAFNRTSYFLLPNGRYSAIAELYNPPLTYQPLAPRIVQAWGRYRLQGDEVELEHVGQSATLHGGRRRLEVDDTCYDNVKWRSDN